MSIDNFIKKLMDSQILRRTEFNIEGYVQDKIRYINPSGATLYQIAVSLLPKSYLSHYSAVFFHGLTTQVPKTIYVTFEQSKKQKTNIIQEQHLIDEAFKKKQRISGAQFDYDDHTIVFHNGKNTNRAGVYSLNGVPVTNIERTLIDIAVRPNYAGGVYSVLEAYKKAIDKISINKLIAVLDNINYAYPYHQTIGFYLERAGYEGNRLDTLRKREVLFDFYLTYEMQDMEYSNKWRLYYPKGL